MSSSALRRTKIVATIGPATGTPDGLRALVGAGIDVARLNLAHSDPATHARNADQVRAAAGEAGRIVGLLADLPGPKMRTGEVRGDGVLLVEGQSFALASNGSTDDETSVATTVPDLDRLVSPGDDIYLADGQIVLEVRAIDEGRVITEVLRGGRLHSGKGMHVPGAEEGIPSFGEADERALEIALELDVDLVGLSFVRSANDVERVRSLLPRDARPLLVAKIETRAAVGNLAEIVRAADSLMVARGDLGIQLPLAEVPSLQKRAIASCNAAGKPVITATQMLESMTRSPLPTRAEVTDVANAVYDGTDALMLSEETAIGGYPLEAVRSMSEIALEAERSLPRDPPAVAAQSDDPISWAMARAAVQAAEEVGAAAIVCPTRTGSTARRVAAFRPTMPILALDHSLETLRPLALLRGVVPFLVPFVPDEDLPAQGVDRALHAAIGSGIAAPGSLIALVAGGTHPRTASTDLVRILHV